MSSLKSHYQTTIDKAISFVGIGVHSGEVAILKLKPTTMTRGIVFRRMDVSPDKREILARQYNVSSTTLSTTLTNDYGTSVSTVEHLMAALYGCGIDNVIVEVDGPEIPILDGSARDFVVNIEQAGVRYLEKERSVLWVQRKVEVVDGDKSAMFLPSFSQSFSVSLDFPGTAIGQQAFRYDSSSLGFKQQVANARTFGFAEQVEALKAAGFAKGGLLSNAILVDKEKVVNPEQLRYKTEFARHKVLDAMGDLALSGYPIIADYHSHKGGHDLNHKLVTKLMADQRNWRLMTYTEYADLVGPQFIASSKSAHKTGEISFSHDALAHARLKEG
ncbi:UDP-3-O-acyl-N-acetylglucosamine deacetylase [Alkalimarinus sediminis]|uniref:UDP-3-O-acyl-N-acetylglucosamine deacetylase n=2 Tax=Alkalimarinus sediminis TaxID=1632866 RepID=A0A9E8HJE2_9ALTE|nr:UDP-3-O-acyl-N-acetylglucosamine deacetylase [Alkalimarinus sediminis]UZW73801.1 UDP-3-O-acyl-N-acetylglucosamine deacetylase [Alkalimarinus sediminis]